MFTVKGPGIKFVCGTDDKPAILWHVDGKEKRLDLEQVLDLVERIKHLEADFYLLGNKEKKDG